MLQRAPHTGDTIEGLLARRRGWLRRRLTVVLLTHNCASWLPTTLVHLLALGVQVIAVDNASTDGTTEILKRASFVRTVMLHTDHGAAGRNAGVARVRTPYIAFCDDNGWYEPGGLATAVELLESCPHLAVVNARMLVEPEGLLDPVSAEMARSPLPELHGIPGKVLLGFAGRAAIVRRAAFLDAGGYDPRLTICGEEEPLAISLAMRGWQMRYVREVVMHHFPDPADARRIGRGVRNTVTNAWLHRPFLTALRWTWFVLMTTPSRWQAFRGIVMAFCQLPWILHERRTVPPELERMLSLLDDRRRAAARARRRRGRSG